jgi:hypothetical protein
MTSGKEKPTSQQEGGGDRDNEARQGRDPACDRGSHGLAEAHRAGLRQSILGSKGGEKIESSKNAAGERSYHIAKSLRRPFAKVGD